jgi:TrpR-related protein YerC/YecD
MDRALKNDIDQLFEAILRLETVEECHSFFRDLLTENEIREFAERWRVAGMLAEGIPYTTIESQTGLSSRTIARVHKWLKSGKGGYRMMLERMRKISEEGGGPKNR